MKSCFPFSFSVSKLILTNDKYYNLFSVLLIKGQMQSVLNKEDELLLINHAVIRIEMK